MENQVNPGSQPYATPATLVEPSERRTSGLGIASFTLGILAGIATFALIGFAGYVELSTPGGMNEESPIAVIVGLGMFAIIGLCFIGGALGVAALFQSNRTRVFSILGIILNVMVVLGLVGLGVIGMAMEA